MTDAIAALPLEVRIAAVQAYDARYGEMERVLWALSRACRPALHAGVADASLDALVWTVRSWWGVQGVTQASRPRLVRALAELGWDEAMFAPVKPEPAGAERWAVERVDDFVRRSVALGASRREHCLGSKVLHWLLPWRIPIYDRVVRTRLGVSDSIGPTAAYLVVARDAFDAVRSLEGDGPTWLGGLEPLAPLRGYDKCAWWLGGGAARASKAVKDPWRGVRELGLPAPERT